MFTIPNYGPNVPSFAGMAPIGMPGFDQAQLSSLVQTVPTIGAPASGSGIGFNLPTLNTAFGGIQAIGNIWGALSAMKLAREQFNFTKGMGQANLANQLKSYNTQLEGIGRSRAIVEGQSPQEAAAWLERNRMTAPANLLPKTGG